MPLPTFGPYDFTAEFLSEFDFLAEFDFGLDFTYPPASETDSTFGDDDMSIDFTVDGTPGQRRRRWCRRRCSNCMYCTKSVTTLCWYREFLAPGVVRDLTNSLSSSDRYGEFREWFRMPLEYVEKLTELLILRGYISQPRFIIAPQRV